MSHKRCPRVTPAQDRPNARYFIGSTRGNGLASGHPFVPQRQPDEASQPKYEKDWPPSEVCHEEPTKQCAQRRTALGTGVDARICKPALMLGEVLGKNLRIARICDRFSHSDHQLQYQQSAEPPCHTGSSLRK